MRALRSALLLCCCACELLACGASGDHGSSSSTGDGALRAGGDSNFWPVFDSFQLVPRDLDPGNFADATVWVSDRDDGTSQLSYAWSATSGVFTEPWLPETQYSCTQPGYQELTVIVRDPRGCDTALPLSVNCVAP